MPPWRFSKTLHHKYWWRNFGKSRRRQKLRKDTTLVFEIPGNHWDPPYTNVYQKLSDCLNSPFKCPIDALCFTSTHCKGTRLRRVVTVYQKVDMIRCCVKACRWINNWISSVKLLTRWLFAMAQYTRCIIIEIALPKTMIDVGTKQVINAFLLSFLPRSYPALLVCSLSAGGRWIKKEVQKFVSTFFAKLHCFFWSKSFVWKKY